MIGLAIMWGYLAAGLGVLLVLGSTPFGRDELEEWSRTMFTEQLVAAVMLTALLWPVLLIAAAVGWWHKL